MFYGVKLIYDPQPKTQLQKESITFFAVTELESYGVRGLQISASVIELESEQDQILALIILGSSSSFRVTVIDS